MLKDKIRNILFNIWEEYIEDDKSPYVRIVHYECKYQWLYNYKLGLKLITWCTKK